MSKPRAVARGQWGEDLGRLTGWVRVAIDLQGLVRECCIDDLKQKPGSAVASNQRDRCVEVVSEIQNLQAPCAGRPG